MSDVPHYSAGQPMYRDRQGEPMTQEEWLKHFRRDYQRVASDHVDDVHVSTVWLGLDHSLHGNPPLIFESMVFGGPLDEEQRRYSTEEEALAGHAALVAEVRGRLGYRESLGYSDTPTERREKAIRCRPKVRLS